MVRLARRLNCAQAGQLIDALRRASRASGCPSYRLRRLGDDLGPFAISGARSGSTASPRSRAVSVRFELSSRSATQGRTDQVFAELTLLSPIVPRRRSSSQGRPFAEKGPRKRVDTVARSGSSPRAANPQVLRDRAQVGGLSGRGLPRLDKPGGRRAVRPPDIEKAVDPLDDGRATCCIIVACAPRHQVERALWSFGNDRFGAKPRHSVFRRSAPA